MDEQNITSRLRILNQVLFIRRRFTPKRGKVLVNLKNEVSPETILAETQAASGFTTLNLAQGLHVEPKKALAFMKKKLGQTVYKGELLAEKVELLGVKKTLVISPSDGILDFYDDKSGILRMRYLSKREQLVSGSYGIIEQIDLAKGIITIKTQAALIFGIIGAGREREGFLAVLDGSDGLISSKPLNETHRGKILVGGGMFFPDALQKALQLQVGGVITGGINVADLRGMRGGSIDPNKLVTSDVGLSLVVTEGFGLCPIGEDIYELLKAYDRKFALIDGNKARIVLPSAEPSCMINIRKTVLPFEEKEMHQPLVSEVGLKIGMRVRLVEGAHLGLQGQLMAIDKSPTLLASGLKTCLATVVTKTAKVKVALKNLEAI